MDLAESDPDALSSSMVLQTTKEYRIDKEGRPLKDDDGETLPPLWHPTAIHSSDVVDTGDAVDGFLSAERLELAPTIVHRAIELLDRQFKGKSPEFISQRCSAWLNRYLVHRFGEQAAVTYEDICKMMARLGPNEEPSENPIDVTPAVDISDRRLARLLVSADIYGPDFLSQVLAADCEKNPLPVDVQLVDQNFDKTWGRWELLLHSEQFEPVDTCVLPPLLDTPVIGQCDGGDPDVLRRRMKLRERRLDS
jgi:hypothetical protein